MGAPELATDPRFEDMAARACNMAETDAAVTAWTETLPKAEVFRLCQAHNVICAPVRSLHDVLHDPHLLARGALAGLAHEQFGEVRLPTTPLRFEDEAPPVPELPRATARTTSGCTGSCWGCRRRRWRNWGRRGRFDSLRCKPA